MPRPRPGEWHGPPDRFGRQEREVAAGLTRRTRWLVLWGPWSRLYWAFARFGSPLILWAPGPRELLEQMHGAELAACLSQAMIPAGHARDHRPRPAGGRPPGAPGPGGHQGSAQAP